MSPGPAADPVAIGGARRMGLVVLGAAEVAVPIELLREVLPCPAELAGLPVRSPMLLGAMDLRDQVLPVVDVLQPREVDLGGTRIVVVLSHDGRTVGLLADGIRGLVDVEAGRMHEVSANEHALLASHTFLHPDDRRVVSVLDVERVLGLDGVPAVHADASAVAPQLGASGPAAAGERRRMLTVLRCGAQTVAIDVADVHTIVPAPQPQPSVLAGGCCLGSTPFRDERVALVDPLAVLGVGAMAGGTPEAGVVLLYDDGLLVLGVSATVDIVAALPSDVLPVPQHAVARPDIVAGLLQMSGAAAPALVLDTAALRADPELRTLASLRTPLDPSAWADDRVAAETIGASAAGTAGDREACLSYSIGFDLATPLAQVTEIIAVPDDLVEMERAGRTVGVALHRGVAIPMLPLADLLGREMVVPATTQCALLVDVDGERWGVVVDRLNEIAPRTWCADEADHGADGALAGARLITLGGSRRLIPQVDLEAVVRRTVNGQSARSEDVDIALDASAASALGDALALAVAS